MPKVTVPNIGLVDATPVQIVESTERWSDVKLDDGTVLRVKAMIISAMRIDGKYDQHGNPMYAIQAGQAMTVASAPDHLKQPSSLERKVQ